VWVALFAPAGTPRAIIDKVAGDVTKTLESPEIKERFAGAGIETGTGTPDGLAQFLKKDFDLWDKLIKAQGIKLD
jgi:tripartite-type tricarboxylate transporter receptor subunit TctC